MGYVPKLADVRRIVEHVREDTTTPLVRGAHCWVWKKHVDAKGYGQVKLGGRARWAHRASYEVFRAVGIRPGQDVDHICRNRSCCNPRHLRATTRPVNSARNSRPPVDEIPF